MEPPKRGLNTGTARGALSHSGGWSLCIGSGVSLPAFPDWAAFAASLARDELPPVARGLMAEIGPDALIQSAQYRLGLDDHDFAEFLGDRLYEKLRENIRVADWPNVSACLAADSPGLLPRSVWASFIDIQERLYPRLTAAQLAREIASLYNTHPPTTILSFNAEPLLYALINARLALTATSEVVAVPKLLDRQLGIISSRARGRVPYYYCHGLLRVPGARGTRTDSLAAEHLVFSEASYLRLANLSYSWQASAFISATSATPTVFVGLSLVDRNIRTWLAWTHAERVAELAAIGRSAPSTRHFWIRRRTDSTGLDRWVEASVAHLGIRLVWVDEWTQVGETLHAMVDG